MQRGKYPVKDVEASFQGPPEATYDNSFKMCVITLSIFVVTSIVILLCTLPLTTHQPMPSDGYTDTQMGDRPDTTNVEDEDHYEDYNHDEDDDHDETDDHDEDDDGNGSDDYDDDDDDDDDDESYIPSSEGGHKTKSDDTPDQSPVPKNEMIYTLPQEEIETINEESATEVNDVNDNNGTPINSNQAADEEKNSTTNATQQGTHTEKKDMSETEQAPDASPDEGKIKYDTTNQGASEDSTPNATQQTTTTQQSVHTENNDMSVIEQLPVTSPDEGNKYNDSTNQGIPEDSTANTNQQGAHTEKNDMSVKEQSQVASTDVENKNQGTTEMPRAEEELASTERQNEHYETGGGKHVNIKRRLPEHHFNYNINPDIPLFRHQKKYPDGVVYGCYGYVEPEHKVRSTYYVYDSMGYQVVEPGEQFNIFQHQQMESDTAIGNEKDVHFYPGFIRNIRHWDVQYFPESCSDPVPKNLDNANPTGTSTTVDEGSSVPRTLEGSAKSSSTTAAPDSEPVEPLTPKVSGATDEESTPTNVPFSVSQEDSGRQGSAVSSSTTQIVYTELQTPKHLNVVDGVLISTTELSSDPQEGSGQQGSMVISSTLQTPHMEGPQVEPQTLTNAASSGFQEGTSRQGSVVTSSIIQTLHTEYQQVEPQTPKHSKAVDEGQTSTNVPSSGPQKGFSEQGLLVTSSASQTSHMEGQQVEPQTTNEASLGFQKGSNKQGSVIISSTTQISYIEGHQVESQTPKYSNGTDEEQTPANVPGSDPQENSDRLESADTSSTTQTLFTEGQKTELQTPKHSNEENGGQTPTKVPSSDPQEGSNGQGPLATSSITPHTYGQEVEVQTPKLSNVTDEAQAPASMPFSGSQKFSAGQESQITSSTIQILHTEGQQVEPQTPKYSKATDEEPAPIYVPSSGPQEVPRRQGSAFISSTIQTSHTEDKQLESETPQYSSSTDEEQTPTIQPSSDPQEGSGGEKSVVTSSTSQIPHTEDQQIGSESSTPLYTPGAPEELENEGSSDNASGLGQHRTTNTA